jgi:hypothetical protein
MYPGATSLFGANGLIATANESDDRYLEFAKIEANLINSLCLLPYYSKAVATYFISKSIPFLSSSNSQSSGRIATGGEISNKAISGKEYYYTKYVIYNARNINFS